MTTKILKSSIPSHGIDVSKTQFYRGIDFLQGIYAVESMSRVFESLKILALLVFFPFISIMTEAQEPHIQLPNGRDPCSHTDKHQQSHT
jgi:hypothetical protein